MRVSQARAPFPATYPGVGENERGMREIREMKKVSMLAMVSIVFAVAYYMMYGEMQDPECSVYGPKGNELKVLFGYWDRDNDGIPEVVGILSNWTNLGDRIMVRHYDEVTGLGWHPYSEFSKLPVITEPTYYDWLLERMESEFCNTFTVTTAADFR